MDVIAPQAPAVSGAVPVKRAWKYALACATRSFIAALILLTGGAARLGWPSLYRTQTVLMRGKEQVVLVYEPRPGLPQRAFQVIVTSGDLGWVGLSVDIAEHLQAEGYRVVGFNSRAYLSSFTGKESKLAPEEVSADLHSLLDWADSSGQSPQAFVLTGVSEGAGLNVLAAGQMPPTPVLKGIIALGLPRETTLGWRWTDFPMWVTKRNPREPLTGTSAYLRQLKVPLVMIHSTHDEWDSLETARNMFALAPGPKRFIAVDASNHRFSDKVSQVLSQIDSSLAWMEDPGLQPVP